MTESRAQAAIQAIFRIETPRLIAGLARFTRDLGLAEDLAQDALVTALELWPAQGVPEKPGAWLLSTAKNRAVDLFRRSRLSDRKHEELARELDAEQTMADPSDKLDSPLADDMLRLVFTACHPVLPMEARVALTLRCVGGLTTAEIARAFLLSEPTLAQRIVRAKRTLSDAQVPFEVPGARDLKERLGSVLQVIYLVFNEGYSATAGGDWMRPALCEDALRLGRILAGLLPLEPEVHGLVALMEIQSSRADARVGPGGEPILLLEQNRSRWNRILIGRGLAALERAQSLDGTYGPYALQAALAACHARARTAEETDWKRIVALYEDLARVTPSPIVDLNHAVAVSMASGAAAALPLVDALMNDPALENYHLLPSVRGDLLAKLGRNPEARAEFERAAAMTQNEREKEFLLGRAAACSSKN